MRSAALIMVLAAGAVEAQECRPGPGSNEAKLLAMKSVALAYSPAQAPERFSPGAVQVALDLSWVPRVNDATATPTVCRPGKGPENANLLDLVPRPRIQAALPGGLVLDASWTPPIRVAGVRANLLGVAVSRPVTLGPSTVLSLRAHASVGTLHAPITCPDEALNDPDSECFRGTRSDDRYAPGIFGADASFGFGTGRVRPYAGLGYTRLRPRLTVDFTNQFGDTDNTRVIVDLDRAVVFGGATWQSPGRFAVSAELYAAPSDAVTGRVTLRAALR